jgi:hypothetical protein
MRPAWSLEEGKGNKITENDRRRSLMVKFKTKLLKNVFITMFATTKTFS